MSEMPNLEQEVELLRAENIRLRNLLNIREPSEPEISTSPLLSTEEKIALFRKLFHGRDDTYAVRWESNKTGKSGYAPACGNEWDKQVCRKPHIKCSDCAFRKLLPLTDKMIYQHLSGKTMLGVYPLLQDETCYFLAIDFDKAYWQKDIKAFRGICKKYNVPVLIERSQSGQGAHAWFFFSINISAKLARELGTALLTHTMQLHHELSFDSYDRLFPNQDMLPKGGFGNLIALPLQGQRRQQGNSIFIDEEFEPYSDPWEILRYQKTMTLSEVENLITELAPKGDVMGIKHSETDEEKSDPWITPIKNDQYPNIVETLPSKITIVEANLLYVPKQGLNSVLLNQIKKIGAFQNPEFYRSQRLRLSTYDKPRVIACADDFDEYLGLPRGCKDPLIELFEHYKIAVHIENKTILGAVLNVEFQGELRDEQEKAFKEMVQHDNGILVASTAFGKTIVAIKLIAERGVNTLILVHRQQLAEQWRERLIQFLNMTSQDIGMIGGGKNKPTGKVDIATLQSLYRHGEVKDCVGKYGQVIVDECHHLSAFSFEQVLKQVHARYVLGLTATPIRQDGHHPIIMMQCGHIRYRSSIKKSLQSTLTHSVFPKYTEFNTGKVDSISELYGTLSQDETRNTIIIQDVLLALSQGRTLLLLSERTQHLDDLYNRLKENVEHIFMLRGRMAKKQREKVLSDMFSVPLDQPRLLLSTGKYIGEGFDDPRLDTLFLTLPISWQGTVQQYLGRLHRQHDQKEEVQVYDYVDSQVPMLLKMYQKRLKKYHAIGYKIIS